MKHIALKNLTVTEDAKLKTIKAGEEIPDFETWPHHIQKVHLDSGLVGIGLVKSSSAKDLKPGKESETEGGSAQESAITDVTAEKPAGEPSDKVPVVELFNCDACGKKGFKSAKALRTHATLAHVSRS